MRKQLIDWECIERSYNVNIYDMDVSLREEYEKIMNMKSANINFFNQKVSENLHYPTSFDPGTVASSIYGCEQSDHGDGPKECSPLCIHESCKKFIFYMNNTGTDIRSIHIPPSESTKCHIYATSYIKNPIRHIRNSKRILDKLKKYNISTVEVYTSSFNMWNYIDTIYFNDTKQKTDIRRVHLKGKRERPKKSSTGIILFIFILFLILSLFAYFYYFYNYKDMQNLFNIGEKIEWLRKKKQY